MSNLSIVQSLEVKDCNGVKELRINELPNDIIISCILSHLNVNDAIRACIGLSISWCNLVTLNFDVPDNTIVRYNEPKQYVDWVNHVLELHSAPNIDEFRVQFLLCPDTEEYFGDFDKWVKFAFFKKVKKLELDFESSDDDLSTTYYNFVFTREFQFDIERGLSLLTSLCLKLVIIEEELLDFILSRCQYLERLILEDSRLVLKTKLKVTNTFRRLKHVALRKCTGINEVEVNIAAAVSFELKSKFAIWEDFDSYIAKFNYTMSEFDYCTLQVSFVEDDNIVSRVDDSTVGLLIPSSSLSSSQNYLKSLCLGSVENLSTEFLESLMIHFQLLEKLVLIKVRSLVTVKINSWYRMKHLLIDECQNFEKLEIYLLNVVSLEVISGFGWESITSWNENNDSILVEFPSFERVYSGIVSVDIEYCVQGTDNHRSTVKYNDGKINSNCHFSLKLLHLEGINISGEVLEFVLSRFPLLETLIVKESNDLESFKVTEESSKSLQLLQIDDCQQLKELKIHAPNLTTLALFNNLDAHVVYGCVPSLRRVCFAILRGRQSFLGSFKQIRHVSAQLTKLVVYTNTISKDVVTSIPTFDNVKQLELIAEIGHHNLVPIGCFAEACLQLQEFKLEIKWDYCTCDLIYNESSGDKERLSEGELVLEDVHYSSCTLAQLRSFELVGAFQYDKHIDDEYSLVLYIIKNAIQLEKFICNTSITGFVERFCADVPGSAELVKERQIDAVQQLAKVIPSKIVVQII